VAQTSSTFYLKDSFKWEEKFRSVAGVRGDYYTWHVQSSNPANSSDAEAPDAITSTSQFYRNHKIPSLC